VLRKNILQLFTISVVAFATSANVVLAQIPGSSVASPANLPASRVVDETRAAAAGIRKLTGKHVVIYTDAKSSPAIDSLPTIFDLAVPQWAEYFNVPDDKYNHWQARGFLIRDRETFEALGLMPPVQQDFPNGISVGRDFWLYAQPSDYYTRHLMLHEGTHVFMQSFLGGCGPGWYMEGTAELFGTHRYDERYKQLTLRVMPKDRDDVPMWGRIKLVNTAAQQGTHPLPGVLEIDNSRQMGDDLYAWCWALCKFLDSHPRYRDRFRNLQNNVTAPDFNDRFRNAYRGHWADLQAEWLAFIESLDYGYNFERTAIDFRRGKPLTQPAKVQIEADRGWQSSGLRLEAGKKYHLAATGRYEVANDGRPWPCEPGGITIDYHDGRPLGMLVAAINGNAKGATLADTIPVGLDATITPAASGTLYLRVNDSPARLDDNRGSLNVTISPAG
jgi:hypothetical protein